MLSSLNLFKQIAVFFFRFNLLKQSFISCISFSKFDVKTCLITLQISDLHLKFANFLIRLSFLCLYLFNQPLKISYFLLNRSQVKQFSLLLSPLSLKSMQVIEFLLQIIWEDLVFFLRNLVRFLNRVILKLDLSVRILNSWLSLLLLLQQMLKGLLLWVQNLNLSFLLWILGLQSLNSACILLIVRSDLQSLLP